MAIEVKERMHIADLFIEIIKGGKYEQLILRVNIGQSGHTHRPVGALIALKRCTITKKIYANSIYELAYSFSTLFLATLLENSIYMLYEAVYPDKHLHMCCS